MRRFICNQLLDQLTQNSIYWVLDISPEVWKHQMLQDKHWGDSICLQIAANIFDANIILIPLSPESAHHDSMYTEIRSIHNGNHPPPLFMLYFEEWIMAGHYQSIEPDPLVPNNILKSHYENRSRNLSVVEPH